MHALLDFEIAIDKVGGEFFGGRVDDQDAASSQESTGPRETNDGVRARNISVPPNGSDAKLLKSRVDFPLRSISATANYCSETVTGFELTTAPLFGSVTVMTKGTVLPTATFVGTCTLTW